MTKRRHSAKDESCIEDAPNKKSCTEDEDDCILSESEIQIMEPIQSKRNKKGNKHRKNGNKSNEIEDMSNENENKLYVILEQADMELVKNHNKFELLNTDFYSSLIKRSGREESACRPDILHQCLLMLCDSPLNKAGKLQVLIHSRQGALIRVDPTVRIPRTFRRFSFLMGQLLDKKQVCDADGAPLFSVIRGTPLEQLPPNCPRVALSVGGPLLRPRDLVPNRGGPLALLIGAMAEGKATLQGFEETFAISSFHLSGATTCDRVCEAFEEAWGVH